MNPHQALFSVLKRSLKDKIFSDILYNFHIISKALRDASFWEVRSL